MITLRSKIKVNQDSEVFIDDDGNCYAKILVSKIAVRDEFIFISLTHTEVRLMEVNYAGFIEIIEHLRSNYARYFYRIIDIETFNVKESYE